MIPMDGALRLIEQRRRDAIVVSTATGARGWQDVSHDHSLDLPITGSMGKASSIALGLCMARPDRKVIVVDGDGSLLMNLGSLVTVAGRSPANLYHFVLDNDMYASTGGQPVPNAGGFSLAGLAEMSGYAAAFQFDDLEEFAVSVDDVMNTAGPVLVNIKTEPEVETRPSRERPRMRRTPEAMVELRRALGP